VADETEEELLAFLEQHSVGHVWETTERVLAVVTGAEGDDAVIHRAARIASRMKAALEVALVVDSERTNALASRLDALARAARDVGATTTDLLDDDVAAAVVEHATRHHATQLVLSAPSNARFGMLRRTSKLVRLLPLASSAGIDVHLIAPSKEQSGAAEGDSD
jgi:two-component system, OmpR family, sensor histidine kinase KdpD